MRGWALASVAMTLFVASFAGTAHAQSCDPVQQLLGQCPPPPDPPPAPDPGGSEEPNQTVPPPGKAFGFNLGYMPHGDVSPDKSLAAMHALNVTHLRFGISWEAVFTSTPDDPVGPELRAPIGSLPSDSSIAQWDRQYLDLVANGITPVIIVWDARRWASTLYKCADAVYQALHSSECPANWREGIHFPHPDFYPHFRSFVRAIAVRYPSAIIEAHNEPDQIWNSGAAHRVDSKTAGAIQCELYQAVRSLDSRPVLSMAMSFAHYEQGFIAEAKDCYTAFSFHPYPSSLQLGEGSTLADWFAGLRSARSAAGDTKPIWVTETGYTFVPTGDAAANRQKEEEFADASRRLYNKLSTMPDVAAVLFHTLRDRYGSWTTSESDPEWHFGFNFVDWSPKPRMCTFVGMAGNTWPGC